MTDASDSNAGHGDLPDTAPADADVASRAVQEQITAALRDRPEILEAYLFGSVARGTAAEHSDVDVAVTVADGTDLTGGYGYEAELGAALMSALGRNRVDVVILNRAPPVLYHRVLRDGVRLLCRDLRATTVREGRALSRYFDYIPQLAKMERAAAARMQRGDFGRRGGA